MKYVHNDVAWAKQLVQDFDEYIDNCMESVDVDAEFETVSGEFYCGCTECYHREVIMWLMPRLIDAYREGIIEENV